MIKKTLKIIGKILLSLIGIFLVIFLLCRFVFQEKIISLIDELQYKEYVEKLVNGGAYSPDTISFEFTCNIDESKSKEIRDYFKLDSIIAGTTDTWNKTMKIALLAAQIPHEQPAPEKQPKNRDAINLWKWSKEHHSGFNCRLHGIMLHEMLLAEGITNRVVTCLPCDSTDSDCHVVNNVWIPEKKKWQMIDSDGREYAEDEKGNVLSLAEMRERMIAEKSIVFYSLLKNAAFDQLVQKEFLCYWAKNLYHFCCIENTSYGIESASGQHRYIDLIPQNKSNIKMMETSSISYITDAKRFWAEPN